jgi:hypothetical protein
MCGPAPRQEVFNHALALSVHDYLEAGSGHEMICCGRIFPVDIFLLQEYFVGHIGEAEE